MSAQPLAHPASFEGQEDLMARLTAARRLGSDVFTILCMTLAEYGLFDQSVTGSGDAVYTPTQRLAEALGLDEIGIGVEDGCWIRFSLDDEA